MAICLLSKVVVALSFSLLFMVGCSNDEGLLWPYTKSKGDFEICDLSLVSDGGSVGYCLLVDNKKLWVNFDASLDSNSPCTFELVVERTGSNNFEVQAVPPNSETEEDLISLFSDWLDTNVDENELAKFSEAPPKVADDLTLLYGYSIWHTLQLISQRDTSPYCSNK